MALSNAERQRKWRQKQREENYESYLRKERRRKQKKYVPTHELSDEKKEQRRNKCREDYRKHYIRKKKQAQQSVECESTSTRASCGLKVKMNFSGNKGLGVKRRYTRALRKAYRDIDGLRNECEKLKREKRKMQKRVERERLRVKPSTSEEGLNTTPRSKTAFMLKKAGMTVNKRNTVHKRLVFGNAVIDAIRESASKKKSKKSVNIQIGAQILKKYRCIKNISKETRVSRHKLSLLQKPRLCKSITTKYGKQVRDFLEREDNSTQLPGKRDVKMSNKVPIQKRILNDYLHNLHQKFQLEYPETKLSRSSFCKLRPEHILLTSFSSRRTCLCTYHQNFSLKIKAMKREGLKCSDNPDVFISEFNSREEIEKLMSEVCVQNEVKYRMWKKVSDGEKLRWKEIEEHVSKNEFIQIVLDESDKFRGHVNRVKNQYSELRRLRKNLPQNEVLLWMDFAENYNCTSVEEVQSAYWNSQMVSLHTMVVYFPNGFNKTVQSYVALSNVLSHNATVVYTILKKVIPLIKCELPRLKTIHYLTDSPSSQYRNKTIFQIVCEHEIDFGISARWNYLETGHGKGPCDGLGASVKRMADMAVKQQKCLIQDANDFYEWAIRKADESKVKYIQYTEGDIEEVSNILKEKRSIMPIQGTMKLHAVVPINSSNLLVRELSCYCQKCLHEIENTPCCWEKRSLSGTKRKSAEKENENDQETNTNESVEKSVEVVVDDWVAAVYDGEWFIGKVTDQDDEEYQINFLTKSGKYGKAFKYPAKKDELWIEKSKVLTILNEVQETGKARKCYRITDKEEDLIIEQYNKFVLNGH